MGWWSWALTAAGVTGLWLAGQKNMWGWAVGLAAQPLWMAYGLITDQYGFVVSGLVYGAAYARNFVRWWRERPTEVLG
jgi:hypothetical protein